MLRLRTRTLRPPWPRSRHLRTAVDAFAEAVTVNADDPAIRAARLGLLDRFRAAVQSG